MTDQNRKTLRSFYCRDYLWELFEQMTSDLGCSMDYLINESMRHYARSRDYVPAGEDQGGMGGGSPQPQSSGGYGQAPAGGGGGGFGQPAGGYGQAPRSSGYGQPQPQSPPQNPPMAPAGSFGSPMEHRTFNQIPPVQQQGRPQQPQAPQPGGFGQQQRAGGPPPPPPRPGGQPAGGGWASGGGSPMSSGGYGSPPPQPQSPGFGGGGGAPQMGQASQPPIYLLFNNNRYVVDKDKFVIGRGSQQTDLTIRDGNISRKHCAVIYRNGSYYIKDMGSTNGVEYRGNRIESKKIEEGDTFYLCDYELRFTYRP